MVTQRQQSPKPHVFLCLNLSRQEGTTFIIITAILEETHPHKSLLNSSFTFLNSEVPYAPLPTMAGRASGLHLACSGYYVSSPKARVESEVPGVHCLPDTKQKKHR